MENYKLKEGIPLKIIIQLFLLTCVSILSGRKLQKIMGYHTSAKEVMFMPAFICLFVTQKVNIGKPIYEILRIAQNRI